MRITARQLPDLRRALVPVWRNVGSICFSQFGEDRLLSTLGPQRTGFYIDVGAYHPWQVSNTYKLYLRGWKGITVEPNVDAADLFKRLRPRDLHLSLGISRVESQQTYYRFTNPLENTFHSKRASGQKDELVGEVRVRCVPLREVVSTHCPGVAIDLLSVDCEGQDYEVLTSLNWNVTRPTVVIVEDFKQMAAAGRERRPSKLRELLLDLQYAPVAQSIFSFIYLDLTAFDREERDAGFRFDRSKLGSLRREFHTASGSLPGPALSQEGS